ALAIADNYDDLQEAVEKAESDADRAETARDLAVNAAGDLVAQGHVPIRNSLDSAAALPVDPGIEKMIVHGYSGGVFVSETDPDFDEDNVAYTTPDSVEWSPQSPLPELRIILSKMAAGQSVKIACFGD